MATELKPCPFCGGEAIIEGYTNWWIACKDCRAELSTYRTKEEAIEAWNRRTEDVDQTKT